MTRALAGRASVPFDVPDGISFVDIDPTPASWRRPAARRRSTKRSSPGTEPTEICELHR